MKLFLAGLLMTSFSALACPDLTGTYTQCESDSNRELPSGLTAEISMTNQNSYLITYESDRDTTTQEVIADGVERESVVTSSRFGRLKVNLTASCEQEVLTVIAKTRFLGLKVEETSKLELIDGQLNIDRYKNGQIVESFRCN